MKFSYNWIRELIPGLATEPQALERLITMKTAECEGIQALGGDHVIEVDNKSLTHRPDLWGHLGMAREVAAIVGGQLRDPVNASLVPDDPSPVAVEIADFALCPRYSALMFENVTVQPSPAWLQDRLEAIGLNAINNIVDVSNFVMAELAQPTHTFDAGRLNGETIYVRPAHSGEKIEALNHETYELTPANLIIADARGPVGIGGVIGGLDSAITQETRRIVLESANFQAASVRKTSVQLKLRTDASMRFEKSQDPLNTVRGLARAIALLREVSPGIRLVGGLADRHAPFKTAAPVEVSIDWITWKLGRAVTQDEVAAILTALQFGVKAVRPGVLSVTIPSWRATKDVSMKDDVLEEVGRMIGYDSITPAPPLVASAPPPSSRQRTFHHKVREEVAAQGFTEVYNYSFVNEDMVRMFGLNPGEHVRVANPIASDQTLMRTSLLPRIFRNITENGRQFLSFRLFEIGREIHPNPAGLPIEIPHLMACVFTKEGDGVASLFELKRLTECLLPDVEVQPARASDYEHPERSGVMLVRGLPFGRLFELHPKLGLEGRAALLDVDLVALEPLAHREIRFTPLRRYPTSAFDLSVLMPLREPVGDIQKLLVSAAGPDLVSIEFVRQYTGAPLPDDRKSISFRLTVGASDRTLSAEEAGAVRTRVIDALQSAGYELRL